MSVPQKRTMQDTLRSTIRATGKTGLSDRSIQLTVQVLKSATKWAATPEDLGGGALISRDPLSGFRRPKAKAKISSTWTVEDARTFLAATEGDRLAALWALALTRGFRRGELAGLRWDRVDLEAGVVAVTETRVVVDGRAETSEPKTDAGKRSVPLDDRLVALLRSNKVRQATERLAAGEAYEQQGYVFADELGRPYAPDFFTRTFNRLSAAAGLPVIRLHDTRHTAATIMLQRGVPTKVVSEMLGHSDVSITLGIYQHVMPGMAHDAGAAMSEALLGK